MKKAILLPNPTKDIDFKVTYSVAEKLVSIGVAPYMDAQYASCKVRGVIFYTELPKDAELIIVIGGDGSMIEASRMSLTLDLPLLGINLGKVGYLAEVEPDNLDALAALVNGDYKIDEKMLLATEKIDADGNISAFEHFAVNDVVLSHESFLGICDFKVVSDKGDHVHYRADAVIISTPAGSTAYSLSAGGPIISHELDAIMVNPVCPHSFFNRAIIYNSDARITITNTADSALNLSIDGRFCDRLSAGETCVVCRSKKRIKILSLGETNLFSTLSKKIRLLRDFE